MLSADFAEISPFFRKLFSRADKANKVNWASAPEGCISNEARSL